MLSLCKHLIMYVYNYICSYCNNCYHIKIKSIVTTYTNTLKGL